MEKIIVQIGEGRFYPRLDGKGWNKSVTTVVSACYPKSKYLIDWQIDVGKERADEILKEAGEDGTIIHACAEKLMNGEQVSVAELNDKQKRCVNAFVLWFNEVKPEIVAIEVRVDHNELGYAGRIDLVCKIDGELYIVDYKSSNSVHASHKVQVGGYAKAWAYEKGVDLSSIKGAILHLNSTTKKGYSFLEVDIEPNAEIFVTCNKLFDLLYPKAEPKTIEYPLYFKLQK